MDAIGMFEADANAERLSAEAAADSGFELEKAIDRATFRASQLYGKYLAGAQSKEDLETRWADVKPKVIKIIAEVTTPTSSVIQRVGRALDPSLSSRAAARRRPSSAKAAVPVAAKPVPAPAPQKQAAVRKTAWSFDQSTKLYTSNDPMQKFACPGCGTEQEHIGFTRCAGCDRTWNSWPVRQQGGAKTGASTYVLMAREIKMRGDQYKLAGIAPKTAEKRTEEQEDADEFERQKTEQGSRPGPSRPSIPSKKADGPGEPPMMGQPVPGTMPGDNSAAMGAPAPAAAPAVPGDRDGDRDLAGGVTEDSPIDQIQDALQEAIVALKDVQMLSINPALSTTAAVRGQKTAALRTAMDRFWNLHKQMNLVAGMLAKEANEALQVADPRITSEAQFIAGFEAAERNDPLPAKTGRAWMEGYVAFHEQKRGSSYDTGADIGKLTEGGDNDESNGARNDGSFLGGTGLVEADEERGDAGPFDSSQPASADFVRDTERRNAQGEKDNGQGQSGSIQPTSARRAGPKAQG